MFGNSLTIVEVEPKLNVVLVFKKLWLDFSQLVDLIFC